MKYHGIRPKVYFNEPSLTESEHAPFLDAKIIMKRLAEGKSVTLNQRPSKYGVEDMNITKLDLLIKRDELKQHLDELTSKELSEQEINALKKLAPSYDFTNVKIKKVEQNDKTQTNEKNDQTTQTSTKTVETQGA